MVEESPFDVDIRVGTVQEAEEFPETDKDGMCKPHRFGETVFEHRSRENGVIWIDLGEERVQSCAQLLHHHTADEVEGMQVLVATDLGTVRIAGFRSEVLTLGVPGDDGNPVLVTPEKDVPVGGELY